MSRLIKLAALLCCVIGAATALPALAQGTTSYKWVDDKGVVHYGDRVPPDAVKRERAVLKLVASGYTSPEIGVRLTISHQTVNAHVKNIYRKLQVRSRAQAVSQAAVRGLL